MSRRLTSSPAAVNLAGPGRVPRGSLPFCSARPVRVAARAVVVVLAVSVCAVLGSGCGPMVERPAFPARPDAVRPGDMLGPYDGKVVDADSERPIAGALVAASWAFERGVGVTAPLGAEEYVTQTSVDGRYAIPRLKQLPSGLSTRVRRFTVIIYQRGYVGWRSDRRFPSRQPRRDFSQQNNLVRLERWQQSYAHGQHLLFLGGGPKVRDAAAWEAQQAGVDLEGESLDRGVAGGPSRRLPTPMLDVAALLTDDEIRGVTGYVGVFEDGKLADLPTTEFYDSRHFKAKGQPESHDVGLRVWRLGPAAAEVQYQKLQRDLPKAASTDEIGDASFRASSGQIQGLVFLVRERGVVVSLTCGAGQCADPAQVLTLGKLVESRLTELPAPAPTAAPPPSALPGLDEAGPPDRLKEAE